MKRILLILALSILMFPELVIGQVPFVIEGKISTDSVLHGKIAVISPGIKRDSVELVNNSYRISGTMDRPGRRVSLVWCDAPMAERLKRTGSIAETGLLKFFLSPGTIKIEHQVSFKDAKITGAPLDDDYLQVRKKIGGDQKNVDATLIEYIKDHRDSWLSFSFLEDRARYFGPKLTDSLYTLLGSDIKKNDAVMTFAKTITDGKLINIGNKAPDFTLDDINGNPVALSSYKGKYVLLDFWASWCAPCRAENPTVKGLYDKYHAKGFEVLGVSLDLVSSKNAWLEAIKKDGLTWTQVSDLKGFDSKAATLYGIHGIPANFLIDPSGKIIASYLRGYDLEMKINELFK